MKRFFFIFFLLLIFTSCKKESSKDFSSAVIISDRVSYKTENGNLVLQIGKFKNVISEKKLPFKKAMLLSSSLVGYFLELNLEKKLVGISSPEYIYSDKIHELISQNKIKNIGNEQKYDIEKILAEKPDVIFTNYVPSFDNTYQILKNNGIEIIFIDEYLEQNPLDKTKYLLLFGKLFGDEKLAKQKYLEIEENYNKIKIWANDIKSKPKVLCNEMYGSQWFLPEGDSFVARLIKDAGGDYILNDKKGLSSIPLSFEEVFIKSEDVQYWINISPHKNRKELLAINPNYSKMNVFKSGKLFMINNKDKDNSNDYFESGVVRCDLVLRDYFKVFHPDDVRSQDFPFIYIKELN